MKDILNGKDLSKLAQELWPKYRLQWEGNAMENCKSSSRGFRRIIIKYSKCLFACTHSHLSELFLYSTSKVGPDLSTYLTHVKMFFPAYEMCM